MTALREITEWWIGAVALGIDLLGVAVIVGGIAWSTIQSLPAWAFSLDSRLSERS